MTYDKNDNPFDKSRVDGYLNLIDGTGTVTFELQNIQYNESGDFYLEIFKLSEKLGVTVDVQGKKKILDYFDVEATLSFTATGVNPNKFSQLGLIFTIMWTKVNNSTMAPKGQIPFFSTCSTFPF